MALPRKHIGDPWLRHIQEGRKLYEGKLDKKTGDWTNARKGAEFLLWNKERSVCVRIVGKLYFYDFGHMWRILKDQLLPDVRTEEKAKAVYREYYTDEDVDTFGTVAYLLEVVE